MDNIVSNYDNNNQRSNINPTRIKVIGVGGGGRRYCRRVRGAAACVRHFTEKTGAGWLRFFYALQYSTY